MCKLERRRPAGDLFSIASFAVYPSNRIADERHLRREKKQENNYRRGRRHSILPLDHFGPFILFCCTIDGHGND